VVLLEGRALLSTFTVTSTSDEETQGQTTLRDAIIQADSNPGPDTIRFSSLFNTPQAIYLQQGELFLDDDGTSIIGPGADLLTVDGKDPNNHSRVFEVHNASASLSGLTISGGRANAVGLADSGGGLYNGGGDVSMTDVVVSGNHSSADGGGLFNVAGTLTLLNVTISGNSADSDGAGVFNGISGTLSLTNSTIDNNSANADGGGLTNLGGTAMITNATFGGNSALFGGGLFNSGPTSSLTVINATFSDNIARGDSGDGKGDGGGLADEGGSATLTNTIVANSTRGDILKTNGTISGSHNLVQDGSGGLPDTITADPLLAPLGDYGGSTRTYALLPGSPAIDAGLSIPGSVAADQRSEPMSGQRDIGAFESQGFTLATVPGSTPQSTPIRTAFPRPLAVTVTPNNPAEPVDGGVIAFARPANNQASATLSAPSATISGGQAGVTVTANAFVGRYTVTATAAGANTATFDLTNAPITVVGVGVAWGQDTAGLATADDGLRLLPAGRSTDLPWLGIRTITVTLSGPTTLAAFDVRVTGLAVARYGPVTIPVSGSTYTITLAQPINAVDRVTLTIGNASIATFTRRLDVLPGDVNDDGVVDIQDATLERNMVIGLIPVTAFGDINGDGAVDTTDYNLVRQRT
jgi:hypothetical protein